MTEQSKDKKRKKKTDGKRNLLQKMDKRFGLVMILIFVLFLAVAIKLLCIYIFDGERYAKAAQNQSTSSVTEISAKRGDIMDRNGVVLATSNVTYNLILDPEVILSNSDKYLEPTVALIEKCFGFAAEDLKATIAARPDSNYVVLAKSLSYGEVEDFIALKAADSSVAGIWLEENSKRNYAYNTLACSVLGFMSGGSGLYGLERQYDDELTGTNGREYTYLNSENVLETERIDPEDGCTLKTTLDVNIQTIVENKIAEFKTYEECGTVACIIQNPNTGEIYAMADSGSFDCNNPYDLSTQYTAKQINKMTDEETSTALSEIWSNFCISQSYEPGSTYKPFTLAAGLEENLVTMDDTYNCEGSIEFQDDTVKCHDTSGHGTLTTKQAIAESCNVALMTMADKIGVKNFAKYQRKFGFGKYTDIDLPSEISASSLLYTEENMKEIDLATNSFGQNFNLSMIQLSTAFCSIVNGGYLYRPYVVKSIYSGDGELVKTNEKTLVSRTVSEDTCEKVKECLRAVVVEGTGDYANVAGYVVSGKTGTAEKTGRQEGNYLVSFIGFAPYENPEVVCYVVIDEPEAADEHGVSSHLFNMIMSEVLPYMNVTPASLDTDPEAEIAAETEFYTWEEIHPDWDDMTVAERKALEKEENGGEDDDDSDGEDDDGSDGEDDGDSAEDDA